MNMEKSVLSHDNFFTLGLKNLVSKEFLNEFFTVIDLDSISKNDMKNMVSADKEVIAFASSDLAFLNADEFKKFPVLDKKSSIKNILSFFMQKNESSIYHSSVSLTKREKEILALLRKDISNNCISKILNIKMKTVYTYRRNIMKKLGCKNRIGFQKMILKEKQPIN